MIAGPTIAAMKFAGSEPVLCELFANLLVNSMDARTAHTAHPSFVEVIKQLSPDEAKILQYIATTRAHLPVVTLYRTVPAIGDVGAGEVKIMGPYSQIGVLAECEYPDLVPSYLSNLCRLELGQIPGMRSFSDKRHYEGVKNDPRSCV